MIQADLAEFVDDDQRAGDPRAVQHRVDERGLAATQEAGDERYGNARIGRGGHGGVDLYKAMVALSILSFIDQGAAFLQRSGTQSRQRVFR